MNYKILLAVAATVSTTLSASLPAFASSFVATPSLNFSNGANQGFTFETKTLLRFDFVESRGKYKSNLGIYTKDQSGNFTLLKNLFQEVGKGYDLGSNDATNDWLGTCGKTVLECNTSYNFLPGVEYFFGLTGPGQTMFSNNSQNARLVYGGDSYTYNMIGPTTINQNIQALKAPFTQQKKALTTQRTNLTSQLTSLTNQRKTLTSQLNSINSQIATLNNQLKTLNNQRNSILSQLGSSSLSASSRTSLNTQLNTVENSLQTVNNQLATLNVQIPTLTSQIDQFNQQIAGVNGQISSLNQQIADNDLQMNQAVESYKASIPKKTILLALDQGLIAMNDSWSGDVDIQDFIVKASISSVPEPKTSLAVLGVGVAGIWGLRRRRVQS